MPDHLFDYTCRAAKVEEVEAFHPLWKELDWDPCETYPTRLLHALQPGDFRVITRSLKSSSDDDNNEAELLGCLLACTHGTIGFIGYFSIFPQYRGQGIGTLLLEDSLNYLQKAGCTSIGLDSEPKASQFYLKYGFERTGNNVHSAIRQYNGDEEAHLKDYNDLAFQDIKIMEIKPSQDQEDFNAFTQRDLEVTSFQRDRMLKSLFSTQGWHVFHLSHVNVQKVASSDARSQAVPPPPSYIAIQPDANGLCIGPMYAQSENDAKQLLDHVATWYNQNQPVESRNKPFKLGASVYGARTRQVMKEFGWTEGAHHYERMWLGPEPEAQSKLSDKFALIIDSGLG